MPTSNGNPGTRANPRVNSKPEVLIRSKLHQAGLRFRNHLPLRPDDGRPVTPDVVLVGARIAVFVDGCFWHGCPSHGRHPVSNLSYWTPKLARIKTRDLRDSARLQASGWQVIRVWEHDDPELCVRLARSAMRGTERQGVTIERID